MKIENATDHQLWVAIKIEDTNATHDGRIILPGESLDIDDDFNPALVRLLIRD